MNTYKPTADLPPTTKSDSVKKPFWKILLGLAVFSVVSCADPTPQQSNESISADDEGNMSLVEVNILSPLLEGVYQNSPQAEYWVTQSGENVDESSITKIVNNTVFQMQSGDYLELENGEHEFSIRYEDVQVNVWFAVDMPVEETKCQREPRGRGIPQNDKEQWCEDDGHGNPNR